MYRKRVKYYLKDEQIYNFYIKNFVVGKKMHSPFRYDPGPSFFTKYTDEGRLIWYDFGIDQENYDAIGFVSALFRVGREGAARKIFEDIIDKGIFPPMPEVITSNSLPEIVITDSLHEWELPFWEQFLISEKTLIFYNVKSLAGRYKKDKLIWKSSPEEPKYVYLFRGQDVRAKKIYNPYGDKKKKFRWGFHANVLEGYDQLPDKGDLLVVTSSLKDCMVLYEAGFTAVAPSSETDISLLLEKKEEFNSRFGRVITLLDNDETGRKFSSMIKEETGWDSVFMKEDKDPSDSVKRTGDFTCILQACTSH